MVSKFRKAYVPVRSSSGLCRAKEPVDPASLQRFLGPRDTSNLPLHRPLAQPLDRAMQQRNRLGEDCRWHRGRPDCARCRQVSGGRGRYPPFGDHHRPAAAQGTGTGECGRIGPHQFGSCVSVRSAIPGNGSTITLSI